MICADLYYPGTGADAPAEKAHRPLCIVCPDAAFIVSERRGKGNIILGNCRNYREASGCGSMEGNGITAASCS